MTNNFLLNNECIIFIYNLSFKTGSLEPPPNHRVSFFFEKKTFQVDASLNINTLTETEISKAKIKNQQYER